MKIPHPYIVGEYVNCSKNIGGQAYLWATEHNISAVLKGDYSKIQPVAAEFDLSTSCIYHCEWCAYRASKTHSYHSMVQHDDEYAETIVDALAEAGVRLLVLTVGGEPLLSASLEKVVQRARSTGMAVTLYTNGFLLNEERSRSLLQAGTGEIRLSLNDISSQKGYDIAHGAPTDGKLKYSVVLDNLISLLKLNTELNTNTTVGCSFVLTESSAGNLEQSIFNLSSRLRRESVSIDYIIIRPAVEYWPHSREGYSQFLPDLNVGLISISNTIARFSNHKEVGAIFSSSERFHSLKREESGPAYNRCLGFQSWLNIGPDGTAYLCCETKHDRKYSMGNILTRGNANRVQKLFSAPIACHMREDDGSTTHCPTRLCKPSSINSIFFEIESRRNQHTGLLPDDVKKWLLQIGKQAKTQHQSLVSGKALGISGAYEIEHTNK